MWGAKAFEFDYDLMEGKFWLKNHPDKKTVPFPCKNHSKERVKQVETKKLMWNYFFRFQACKKCGHIFDFRWIDVRDLWDLGLVTDQVAKQAMLPYRKFDPSDEELQKRLKWFYGENLDKNNIIC